MGLDAVAGIQVFRQGIGLPAASVDQGLFSQHTAAAVEVLKTSGRIPAGLFNQEMDIDTDGDGPGQEIVIPVEVAPTASG